MWHSLLLRKCIPHHQRYGTRFVFRQGSPLVPADLQLVAASKASATIVVSDASRKPDEADAQSVRYVQVELNCSCMIVVKHSRCCTSVICCLLFAAQKSLQFQMVILVHWLVLDRLSHGAVLAHRLCAAPDQVGFLRCAILLDELENYRGLRHGGLMGHIIVELKTSNVLPLLRYSCSKRVMALPTGQLNAKRVRAQRSGTVCTHVLVYSCMQSWLTHQFRFAA